MLSLCHCSGVFVALNWLYLRISARITFQKSDLEPEIEQELICATDTHVYTNPKYEIQYFIGLVFV